MVVADGVTIEVAAVDTAVVDPAVVVVAAVDAAAAVVDAAAVAAEVEVGRDDGDERALQIAWEPLMASVPHNLENSLVYACEIPRALRQVLFWGSQEPREPTRKA